MRVLVTGAAGFIGSHLCERLLGEGHEVIALDDLSTGRLDNLAPLLDRPWFRFVHQDAILPFSYDVDRIYNLACPASPQRYQADPVRTLLTNVHGALNCLELARRTGARVLQASTSEVYGDPLVHPQPETYRGNVNPIGPRACYDEGKRCAETLMIDYRARGVDTRIARIFNTYGPRMALDDGRVLSNFVRQAIAGEDLTVYGDGSQTRSFCYVDDLVDGLVALMEHPEPIGPVNLGNPCERSVLDIAHAVLDATGSTARIVHRPLPADDPKQRRPDITLARRTLAFCPRVDLETGLARMIDDFRARTPAHRPSSIRRVTKIAVASWMTNHDSRSGFSRPRAKRDSPKVSGGGSNRLRFEGAKPHENNH
jgi:UDP-glucuronate decarboxylase